MYCTIIFKASLTHHSNTVIYNTQGVKTVKYRARNSVLSHFFGWIHNKGENIEATTGNQVWVSDINTNHYNRQWQTNTTLSLKLWYVCWFSVPYISLIDHMERNVIVINRFTYSFQSEIAYLSELYTWTFCQTSKSSDGKALYNKYKHRASIP